MHSSNLIFDRNSVGTRALHCVSGLALSAAIAMVSITLGDLPWLQSHGLSALIVAILLGILLGNTIYPRIAVYCGPGVSFSKQTLLRAGIVLYGFRLTFHDVAHVGTAGVVIDALVLTSTFALALLLGQKVLGLDRHTSVLIGAGSAICGAAAVMATEPVVKARAEQVTVAVSTVVVFGTLAIVVYPLLYQWNLNWHLLPADMSGFGIYIGSTVHEVAQVLAAARSISPQAADSAVIAKLVRVMMLAPFLLALSVWMRRNAAHDGDDGKASRVTIPWFAFAFLLIVGLNTVMPLSADFHRDATAIDTWLLTMSMAALGLTTHLSAIRRAGLKPLILAALLFGWLVAGGALINCAVTTLAA
ncbi:MAG TPA: YeiH family protein [Oxalicibacterium sp.]|uniref:YeiH family protein n=1 Tax=Oxalicibacterium sp. TaxID=2766525 RepID=UPI002B9A4EF4|nr:YeiH family protein [Oxalicibacterium sp.]HWU98714.1 YeiH family protein [Oxalicibacterium sp.]